MAILEIVDKNVIKKKNFATFLYCFRPNYNKIINKQRFTQTFILIIGQMIIG